MPVAHKMAYSQQPAFKTSKKAEETVRNSETS